MSQIYLFWNNTPRVSDGHSVHHQEFKTVHTATGICQKILLTASSQQYLFKFEILVHLVGFTTEIYYDARPYECQTCLSVSESSSLSASLCFIRYNSGSHPVCRDKIVYHDLFSSCAP